MRAIEAVLLDVGGIFHLPSHGHVLRACERAGFEPDDARLDRAHYRGTTAYHTDYDGEFDFAAYWNDYLRLYVEELGVPVELSDEMLDHLRQEFTVGGLWSRVIPDSADSLRELAATGVRLGVVSNANGTVAEQLREQEILQVGPGIGVEVECVIDSGAVGVMKPDPRIFTIALDAMGLRADDVWYVGDMPGIDVVGARAAGIRPLVMDPFGFHAGRDYDTVDSLRAVAQLVRAA
ncbi:MAG TPA: HAD family hydrolase [Acidimicrobiia bacterium]|nr:HAD family hydrolase [Acidimicrobiia bacterium]